MTHTRSQFLLAATVLGLASSSIAQAQGPVGQGPQGPRPPAGQRGGPAAGRSNPAATFLRMRNALQLTDDQVKKLEALQNAPAPKSNESDQLRARADLMDATQGDGNLAKARAALDRMSALRNERVVAQLKLRQDARAVLTADQKTRLDNMRAAMRGSMRGKMGKGPRAERGGRGQRGPGGDQ